MRAKLFFTILLTTLSTFIVSAQAKKSAAPPAQSARAITVITEPNAVVWLDDVKYGATDDSGKLTLRQVSAGAHRLRVRANGFKEIAQTLSAAQKGDVKIALSKTTDEAEIAFQQAETEAGKDREKAVELYKKAIALRPKYAEANLGLARVLLAEGETENALKAIQSARAARPAYAEASAVEGRIYQSEDKKDKAIATFKRSIAEGKNFQPEARTGLGLLYKDKAESFGATGDFESEQQNYKLAADELDRAAAQLGTAPDAVTIYQLSGDCYERAKMFAQAIKTYEKFLRLFPNSDEAEAVRSFIVQINKREQQQQ
ncbi:MAG: tetratricopeptide repeat protein [Acidobacteria bacterium]|nr:tetratricopeptide repeat protein [Acidobacteriota bacterium]